MHERAFATAMKTAPETQRNIVEERSDVTRYFDCEVGLYRYSQFCHCLDKDDDLYELITGFHTIPVPEETSFEEARSRSLSFADNAQFLERKLIGHLSLTHPERGTRDSVYRWVLEDGSLMTTLSSFRDDLA